MSKTIDVNFTWTKELALETSKLYYEYDMRHSNKRYLGWFFVALVQFGIVGALKHDSYGLLYLSTFLVLYWYYGRWYLRKRMLSRFYEKNTPEKLEVHFTVDDEGIHGDKEFIPWDDVQKVIKLEKGVLIQSLQMALFFENSAFSSVKDKELFLAMAKERGKV
jgi:hypothetical protein